MADVASDPEDPSNSFPPKISFSHVHFYVDHLEDLETYKELENSLNSFCQVDTSTAASPHSMHDPTKEVPVSKTSFQSQGRDLVRQCLAGLGFRITGARYPSHDDDDNGTKATNTRSVLITSRDLEGVQFIVTAIAPETKTLGHEDKVHFQHFDAANVERFYQCHSNRQGIAVLAFNVDSVDKIHSKYEALHPKLIWARNDYESTKILEVFAYYSDGVDHRGMKEPDQGTILRFVERNLEDTCSSVLPGLVPVDASFDQPSQPAYCDHWVSNVHSRTDFLSTLHDTLGFAPKVDFNAGVVAAGEAQIESTVTGNSTPAVLLDSTNTSLRNQSQVYLPINNDLSQVGHVHGFLTEIGQGIQHVASRVENLVQFVQAANDWRKRTGEGFSFLGIPRSYYGTLTMKQFVDANLSSEFATTILEACESLEIMSADGAVDLGMDELNVDKQLESALQGTPHYTEYTENKERIITTILKSRYINLHSLLKDHISESSYLGIVRNQILVDVQGEDLLYQIFTSNILQRHAGEEAPFLEFIQRVCSEEHKCSGCPVKIKPGCGGFGIRNFLTLFLSIELSKAMRDVKEARGDEKRRALAQAMVDCFTDQLNESNPILTEISDAMTHERHCHDMLLETEDAAMREFWRKQLEICSQAKLNGNRKLMDCSNKYKKRMISLRNGSADQ